MSYMAYFEDKSQFQIRQEECISQIEHILGYDIFRLKDLLTKGYELIPPNPQRSLEDIIEMDRRLNSCNARIARKNTKSSMELDKILNNCPFCEKTDKDAQEDRILKKLEKLASISDALIREATDDGKSKP